ncbi:MAG: hypothetical protein RL151_1001 [Bacteroidota bacterium]
MTLMGLWPQDEIHGGMFANDPKKSLSSYVCKRPTKLNVILRPPKDLAVRLPAQEVVLSKKDTMD